MRRVSCAHIPIELGMCVEGVTVGMGTRRGAGGPWRAQVGDGGRGRALRAWWGCANTRPTPTKASAHALPSVASCARPCPLKPSFAHAQGLV